MCQKGSKVSKAKKERAGLLSAKMGAIKDRNGKNLTEAEAIKKRWQEYTEDLYKKDFHKHNCSEIQVINF